MRGTALSKRMWVVMSCTGGLGVMFALALMRPAPRFANGSFEADFEGWSTVGSPELAVGAPDHPATEGVKAVVFNAHDQSGVGSALSQTFQTLPSQRYALTFDAGAVGPIADQIFRIVVEGRSVLLDTTATVAAISAQPFFVPHRLTFVADGDRATVTFYDNSVTYIAIDALLDNVRIVPEEPEMPRIVASPARVAAMPGEDAVFEVEASGAPPLTYQWEFNGRPIEGATGTKYIVHVDSENMAGNYGVTVSNQAGAVRSSAATLTVLPAAILANGSFEYGSARWTFSQRYVSTSTNTEYGVTDGQALAHFNWGQHEPGGTVSQTFKTRTGSQYVLSFDVGAFSLANQLEQRIRVKVAGASELLSDDISVHATGRGGAYQRKDYTFVADSDRTTLTFEDISTVTENIDALLDNVNVEESH